MKLYVGLGNPEENYIKNRHNVGFLFVDALTRDFSWKPNSKTDSDVAVTKETIYAKPRTFMNSSGVAVKKLVAFFKVSPDKLFVIHDDLDLALGSYKIQFGKGPKGHNGISSIEQELGTKGFWRVRIGVDARSEKTPGETYVLSDFTKAEEKILESVFEKITADLSTQKI